MSKRASRRKGELSETELFGVVATVRKEFFFPARLKAKASEPRGVKKAKAAKWCLAQFDVEKLREWLAGNGITLDWILGEMLRVYRDPTTPTTARLRILEQFRAFHRVGASLHRSVQHALREDPDQEPWPRHDLPDPLMKKFGLLDRQVE